MDCCKGLDQSSQVARQIVALQQDAVFQRLVPAFDLALSDDMARPADMVHILGVRPFDQVLGDGWGAVVGQQPWPMEPALSSPAGSTAISSAAVTSSALIVVHSFQEKMQREKSSRTVDGWNFPDDLEMSESRLPEVAWRRRLILELIGSLHHDEGRVGDQILCLE